MGGGIGKGKRPIVVGKPRQKNRPAIIKKGPFVTVLSHLSRAKSNNEKLVPLLKFYM
jgi:hypothetical protein